MERIERTEGMEAMAAQAPSAGALLREVARLHVQLQRHCVAYCGGTTTTQCTILTELGRRGPVTLAELSRRVGFDKSWTSRAVEHLVQDGLVEKVASTDDRRTVQLSLSATGEARLVELNATLNALAEQAFEHIPGEQHETVHRPNMPRTKPHDSGSVAKPSNRDMLFGLGLRQPFRRGCGPLTCADLGMWACRKRICNTWASRRRSIWFALSIGLMATRSLLPAFRLLRGFTRRHEEFASSVTIGENIGSIPGLAGTH